jgi:hypothetical protein
MHQGECGGVRNFGGDIDFPSRTENTKKPLRSGDFSYLLEEKSPKNDFYLRKTFNYI